MRADARQPSPTKSTALSEKISLAKIKEVKNKYPGATVNDVLVAVLCMTLHAYFSETEQGRALLASDETMIRATFPINARAAGSDVFVEGSPNNETMLGVLTFPLNYDDPLNLVWEVKTLLDGIKVSPTSKIMQFLSGIKAVFSTTDLVDQVLDLYSSQSVMLSNVAGPQNAVKMHGKELDDLSFLLYAPSSLYLGIMSYNGHVNCGMCLDSSLGEATSLAKHWGSQFDELYRVVMESQNETIARPETYHWL
jgi:hypothetical protein